MSILIAALGGVAAVLAVNSLFRHKERKIMKEHEGYRVEDFLKHFAEANIPKNILMETYQYLQDSQTTKGFPVCPTDDLYKVYGIWNEDLDDAVLELTKRCGYKQPTTEDVADLPPVHTVKDLIWLLYRIHERQS